MAEKIRVNVEKVELEVNDNGDIIVLPVSDERFIKRLYDFVDEINRKAEEMNFIDKDNVEAIVKCDLELHEKIKSEFDELFGSDAYKKVFGEDVVIGAEYVFDFLDQISPFISSYMEKRNKRLSKYNADRTGSSL